MDKEIIVKLTQKEANECLKALIYRADALTEKLKLAGQKGNVEQVISLSETIKTMQTTMTTLQNVGATLDC